MFSKWNASEYLYFRLFFDIFDVFPNVERDYSAKSILRVNIEFNIEQVRVSAKILLTALAMLTLKRSLILASCLQQRIHANAFKISGSLCLQFGTQHLMPSPYGKNTAFTSWNFTILQNNIYF